MENIDIKQEIEKAIKQDRGRIKALIEDKIRAVNVICKRKWARAQEKGKHRRKPYYMNISRTEAIKLFERLKFRVDNPNYVRKVESPEREDIS